MEHPSLKPKRSVRKFLREEADKIFGRSTPVSPLASQQSSRESSPRAPSPLPPPADQPSFSPRTGLTPTMTRTQPLFETPPPVSAVATPILPDSRNKSPAVSKPSSVAGSSNMNELLTNSMPGITDPTLHRSQRVVAGAWRALDSALRDLHRGAQLLPPVQSAVGAFLHCLDILEEASTMRHEYEEIAGELASLITSLAQHMKPSAPTRMSGSIANFARGIEEQAKLIEEKRDRGTGRRLLEVNIDEEELARCYHRIQSLFRQLSLDADLSVWDIVHSQIALTRLEGLVPAKLSIHDSKLSTGISRRTCTDGTRAAILSELNEWSRDPDAAALYWMNGMVGTGKTTIACTFSESLEERKQLATSFFCTRTVPECREANRIIPTIAYQLAQYSSPFQSALCEVLSQDLSISAKNITKQFERLLKEPLLAVKDAIPSGLVVVIDALDECDDMLEVEQLLSVLLKSAADMPLKFFITSRPEPEIYNRMLAHDRGYRTVLHLHEVERSLVQADIELYLEAELEFMSPTRTQVQELAGRSGTLFIYAATLVRYIRSRKAQTNPQRRLQSVLLMAAESSKQYAAIDALYAGVLKDTFNDEDLEAQEVENVRQVLQTVICIQEPVSVEALAALAGLDGEEQTLDALKPLRAVIHVSEASRLVSTLHASFPDFMFDKTRSGSFCCELAIHSELITQRCFDVMKLQLRFNICKLESSFQPDSEVENLADRVKLVISPALSYACRYWGEHLKESTCSNSLSALLDNFLSNQLLFWMEVLNLKRMVGIGVNILREAKQWLKASAAPAEITRLVEDARDFVTRFAGNPVSQSTPHIYVSLLPFCPKSSSVFKIYWKRTKGLIDVTGSAMRRREAAALASWATRSSVKAIVYSPDGACVAVGCEDGSIVIRNAYDGASVVGPFEGHSRSVTSVAYSPNGTHIASGSSDTTVRVWNTRDGTVVAGPFEGHSHWVLSVAYSPNGARISSGSADNTIRVWDAYDGTLVAGPFEGHSESVTSIAYSPDGTRIVSGSLDSTIRVWGAHDGTLIAGPLEGHSSSVRSVVYSPDGTRIASGSDDNSIRVWNACDGTPVISPFGGHFYSVRSVAYSPDGTRIVSGSADKTTRVWNAHDGTMVAGPFEGHSNSVVSVVYSPDGTRIASGSADKTTRVWNAHDDTLVASPFEGHSGQVYSITYSPDGARIASSSSDIIRVWDANDGAPIAGPFKGHSDRVVSVAFSPDGTRIASGSSDTTVRMWAARDGTLIAGPFEGHSKPVTSVAFSPDGNHIASGSADKTIRVWGAYDGTPVVGPFEGHAGPVRTIAYSPDGTRIVSGSKDHSIRIWDVRNGTLAAEPFRGHTHPVLSVAYSPDGTRIASGSHDHTIRVWDPQDGTLIAGPFEGHTSSVTSVAYSPDGTRIISGSYDKGVRVYACDGTLVAGPFKGHSNWVYSVACSPDGTRIISGSKDHSIRVWKGHGGALFNRLLKVSPESSRPASDDGWVTTHNSQLLFWVPHELRFARITSSLRPLLIIDNREGSLSLDYGDMLFGERWVRCYQQE